jgi:rubredoxin
MDLLGYLPKRFVSYGEEMPDDYECPLCHHGKEDFVKNS